MKIPWKINHVFNSPIWHVVILEEIIYVQNWKMEFVGLVTRSIMMDTEIRREPTQWESQQTTPSPFFTRPEPTLKISPYHPLRYACATTDHCP
jgi:hypothetical protein